MLPLPLPLANCVGGQPVTSWLESDIDWQYRGIHPDAIAYDNPSLYTGADDAARTTAWRTHISDLIYDSTGVPGQGTADPATALYPDGHNTDCFLINTTDVPPLDGYGWFQCIQKTSGDNSGTGQLWGKDISNQPRLWARLQLHFPAGWTQGAGHKTLGMLLPDGRFGHEIGSGGWLFQVGSSANMGSLGCFLMPFADPVDEAATYDIHFAYEQLDSTTICLATFAAIDGNEPQFLGKSYVMVNVGETIQFPTLFEMGINRNSFPPEEQSLYYHNWQCVPGADPWKLLESNGATSLSDLLRSGGMTVSGASGTIPAGGSGTVTLTGADFPVGDAVYLSGTTDNDAQLSVDAIRILNSTTMEVDMTADGDTPTGTYRLVIGGAFTVQMGTQTYPISFEVME